MVFILGLIRMQNYVCTYWVTTTKMWHKHNSNQINANKGFNLIDQLLMGSFTAEKKVHKAYIPSIELWTAEMVIIILKHVLTSIL